MQHMFSSSPWFNTKNGGVQGLGFAPGPVQVPIVNGASRTGFPQVSPVFVQGGPVAPPQAAAARPPTAAPAAAPEASPVAPPGTIPMGKKADCPVCRSFGGGF